MTMRMFALAALTAASTLFALGVTAQEADLSVSKTAPASTAAGSDVSFVITLSNIGPDDAASVMLSDPLPEGLTFVSFVQNTGPAFSCTTPAPNDTSGTVDCSAQLFTANASATFTLVANIPAQTGPDTTFTNLATVTSSTFDPNDENNTGTASTTTPPLPQADLGVTKNGPTAAQPGTSFTYTILLTNSGPATATNVALTDTLPGTMTFASIGQTGGPTLSCTTPAVGAGGTITCTAATMAAGTTATLELTVNIPAGATSGTTFTNSATVTSDADSNPENDTGTSQVTVATSDISVAKSAPAMAASGSNIDFVITVTNNGPDAADSTQFSDTLGSALTFVSIVQNTGPGATCVTPAFGSSGNVSCTITTLLNGQSAQFTLTARIGTNPVPSSVSNTVIVPASPTDPNAGNNQSTTNTTVVNVADLSVVKTGPATVTAGTDITYTITPSNAGPSPAFNVTLTDTLPPNTTMAQIFFSGWDSCTTPVPGTTGTVTCTAARLDPNVPANITLILHVLPSAPAGSSIANTATIAAAADSTPGNNSSTSTATVGTTSDVQVTKSGPAVAGAATNVAYTVIVTNAGPSDAQTVAMTDAVPAGSTFVSVSQTGPAYNCSTPPTGGTGTVTCTIPTLTSGASTTFTITVTTPPGTTSTLSNTANVTTVTTDPNPANNTASASTNVSPNPADLSIVKTSNAPSGTLPNSQVTYILAVANAGPSPANGVTVTDVLPANVTFVSANASQGSCTGTTTVTCNLGTLTSGGSATVTLVVTSGPAFGPIVNTATVASTNPDPDPNPANNTSTVTVNIVPTIPSSSPLSLTLLALGLAAAGLFATRLRG
jgi:uncharacterized repeat protein (TIGR01451 family)